MTFNVLKNKYVLYFLLFISFTNVLGYLTLHDYESLTLMVTIGMLSYYFSKNMIIVLSAAILGAGLLRVPVRKEWPWREQEGLENKDDIENEKSNILGGSEEDGLELLESMEKNDTREGIENVKHKLRNSAKSRAVKDVFVEENKEDFELKEKGDDVTQQYKSLTSLVGKQDGAAKVDLEEKMKSLEPLVKSAENMMKMMESSGMLSVAGKMAPMMENILSRAGKK